MLRKLIWRVFFRQWKISLLLVLYVVVIYGIACFLAQLIDRFDTYKHGGEENFPQLHQTRMTLRNLNSFSPLFFFRAVPGHRHRPVYKALEGGDVGEFDFFDEY